MTEKKEYRSQRRHSFSGPLSHCSVSWLSAGDRMMLEREKYIKRSSSLSALSQLIDDSSSSDDEAFSLLGSLPDTTTASTDEMDSLEDGDESVISQVSEGEKISSSIDQQRGQMELSPASSRPRAHSVGAPIDRSQSTIDDLRRSAGYQVDRDYYMGQLFFKPRADRRSLVRARRSNHSRSAPGQECVLS